MLKQLIQLFAEKFLQSKKEWVAQQRNADNSKKIELSLPNSSGFQTYTPPADGMFVIAQSCIGAGYLEVNASGARFHSDQHYSNAEFYQGITVQVNKGQAISYKAYAPNRKSLSCLTFIPFVSQP